MQMYSQHEREQHLHGAGAAFLLSEKLKLFFQKQFCILTCSATAALHAISIALEISEKKILTSQYHWPGAITPFLLNKNSFEYGKTNANFSLDPSEIERLMPEIVLSVDFLGIAHTHQSEIADICAAKKKLYITDASCSMGAFNENNLPSGFYSDLVVTSFGPQKSFYAGEGGAILTNSEEYYEKILSLVEHPYRHIAEGLRPNYFAMNFRMNPFGIMHLNDHFNVYADELLKSQKTGYEKYLKLKNDNILSESSPVYTPFNSTYQKLAIKTDYPEKLIHYGNFEKEKIAPIFTFEIPKFIKKNLILTYLDNNNTVTLCTYIQNSKKLSLKH